MMSGVSKPKDSKPKRERNYTTVSIPLSLIKKIDNILDREGYQNRADFILEAIRNRLAELEKQRLT